MAKGIIVVDDIPVICAECDFASLKCSGKYLWCNIKKEFCNSSKPDWCPIKEIPARLEEIKLPNTKNGHKMERFSTGFNACLDEIEGKMQSD